MPDKPIIFSAPMVRAILAGSKTQTRRVVKGTPLEWLNNTDFTPEFVALPDNGLCPYGKPGDTLWVRETWNTMPLRKVFYRASGEMHKDWKWRSPLHMPRWASRITLLVKSVRVERLQSITDADIQAEGIDYFRQQMKPSQERAVTRMRTVQQYRGLPELCNDPAFSRRCAWQVLWDSINSKKPGASWADSPWVWVIEFERKEANA